MHSQINNLSLAAVVLLSASVYATPIGIFGNNPSTRSVCRTGEVGIGSYKEYDVSDRGATVDYGAHKRYGAIFAHDCTVRDVTQAPSPFEGGWDAYFDVTYELRNSDNKYLPLKVLTP